MNKTLLFNAAQVVTCQGKTALRGNQMQELSVINNGCVLIADQLIEAVFPSDKLEEYDTSNAMVINCSGKVITPGFIDCHTHFVFGGYRADEFNDRLNGLSYMEIMRRGGGIANTVKATTDADFEGLMRSGEARLRSYLRQGVTTIEGKSGYGLDKNTELKQLAVMDELNKIQPVEIVQTYLGAHAIPKGTDADSYVVYMINEVLPTIAKDTNAEFCDVFCEKEVFNYAQSEKLLLAAKSLGLTSKLHAEEMSDVNASRLGAKLNAASVDHLLLINDESIKILADSDTVAVVLPSTAFSLREKYAPARKMIDNGCAVAIASDLNPGSCFTQSIPLLFALSTLEMRLSVEECFTALTLNAAAALKRADKYGTIERGKFADIVIHDVASYKFFSYNIAMNNVKTVLKKGKVVFFDD